MVKLYVSLLALTLATSSALASFQQPRGGINILRRRDIDPEFSERRFDPELEARGLEMRKAVGNIISKMKKRDPTTSNSSRENLLGGTSHENLARKSESSQENAGETSGQPKQNLERQSSQESIGKTSGQPKQPEIEQTNEPTKVANETPGAPKTSGAPKTAAAPGNVAHRQGPNWSEAFLRHLGTGPVPVFYREFDDELEEPFMREYDDVAFDDFD